RFDEEKDALAYINKIENIYPGEVIFQVKRSQMYVDAKRYREARKLAAQLIDNNKLEPGHRYLLQSILRQTVTNEIGVNYQYIGFSEDYANDDPWHSISGEYQHNFGRTTTLARVTYSERGIRDGILYELEAYP